MLSENVNKVVDILGVEFCCFFYLCVEEIESGYKRGGEKNVFGLGIFLKKDEVNVIF